MSHIIPIMTYCIYRNVRDNIKVWGAIIDGLHPEYRFKRNFVSYPYLVDCSSKFAYYDYFIDVEEGQYFEIGKKSKYKNERSYYKRVHNDFIRITSYEIVREFNEKLY